jgi:hypothetical protein
LTNHLSGVDTILYTGHLYHTTNHLSILTAFTNSSAECLIIDSVNPTKPDDFEESSSDPLNGYIDETTNMVLTRAPTINETEKMLESLGWTITNKNIIYNYEPTRFVVTAIKNT